MKKWISIIVVAFVLVLSTAAIIHFSTLKNDQVSFINYLRDKNDLSSVDILKTVESRNEKFILYREHDDIIAMAYFEPSRLFHNRYVYSGGAKSTSFFDSYNLGIPQETLIVIYGDNTKMNAASISFTNEDITYTEQISNKDYILTVYRLDKGESISAENMTLFNKEGLEIEQN